MPATQRRSADAAIAAVESLPFGVAIADIGGNIEFVNRAFLEGSGFSADEMCGRPPGDLPLDAILHAPASSQPWSGECVCRRKSGESYAARYTVTVLRTAHGEADGYWIEKQSAAAPTVAQNEPHRAEASLSALIESTEDLIWSVDLNFGLVTFNKAMRENVERTFGVRAEVGMRPEDLLTQERATPWPPLFRRVLSEGPFRFEYPLLDGRTLDVSLSPIANNGKITGISVFGKDITARRAAELESQRTEQQYRSLFSNMHEGVGLHRLIYSNGAPLNYTMVDVNRRFEEIVGVKRADVVNKLATDVYGTEEPPHLKQYAAAVESGTPIQFETYFPPLDRYLVISVAPMNNDLFATIFFDTTAQNKSERTMRSLVTAIEQAGETIVITDSDGAIQYCNSAFEKSSGYSRKEAIGRNPSVLKSGRHGREFYAQLWATITAGAIWTGHLTNKKKDGALYEEDATISPIRDKAGAISGFVAVKRDVTERLELEKQLHQAQKLESIGKLAGGVAHDFNNLLTVINGYGDFLLQRLKDPDPLRSYAQEIRKAGERAAGLTRQLLAFSRKQVIEPRVLDLNAAIRESAAMLRRLIGEDIALATELADDLGQVMADPDRIHQVIMNLAVNARDAMPGGGKIDIRTMNVSLAAEDCHGLHADARAGAYVLMTLTDNGHGMDKSVQQQVFEPFFTTKAAGAGTGLGLSTVYGIVRQSDGWIDVWSEVGVGSSFLVYLPRIDSRPVAAVDRVVPSTVRGSETILLVEDQEAVRSFVRAALMRYGYHVIEAADGDAAIAAATLHATELHLLLTDVVLPGMNGKELSERLKEIRPGLKVLFISGYTADVIARRGVLDAGLAFLHKPFSPAELAIKMRAVLAERV